MSNTGMKADGEMTLAAEAEKPDMATRPATESEKPDGKLPDPATVNASVLAFIGDAVYESYARKYVYSKGLLKPDRLNTAATAYVRAEAQAYALDRLMPELLPEEEAAARRGKNHKITSMPKNVDPKVYKKATGFEALVGYLELCGNYQRLEEIVAKAMTIIEEKDFSHIKRK